MPNVTFTSLIFVMFLLSSCKSSDKSDEICDAIDETIICNGGYSYWVNDITAVSNGVVAISGVNEQKRSSQQWVSFFTQDLSEKLAEIPFARDFYVDEHNAPAILGNDDGTWLVVRTGHNDIFEQGRGKLFVHSISENFELTNEVQLSTENGATYAQLVKVNGSIHLLTRDSHNGWGLFISADKGESWSQWQALWHEAGHRYISMDNFGLDEVGNEQLIFNIGHHPTDKKQKIGYLVAKENNQSMTIALSTSSDILLDNSTVASEVNVSIQQNEGVSSNIRFLDAVSQNAQVCHLYSKLDTDNDLWELNITTHNINLNKTFKYNIGTFAGVLGDSSYVNGASIGNCLLNDGEQIDVFIASHEIDKNEYVIERVFIDVQSGVILTREEVIRSKKQLYRPEYIQELNYLMFNEAEFWKDYGDWKATQKVIKLP